MVEGRGGLGGATTARRRGGSRQICSKVLEAPGRMIFDRVMFDVILRESSIERGSGFESADWSREYNLAMDEG